MRCPVTVSIALILVSGGLSTVDGRELVLNYHDPQGTALLLAVVPNAGDLPKWLIETATKNEGNKFSKFAVSPAPRMDRKDSNTRYVLERLSGAGGETGTDAQIEIGDEHGSRVEIMLGDVSVRSLPPCGTVPFAPDLCKISSVASEALMTALQQTQTQTQSFASLLASNDLVIDDRAAKRVVLTVNDREIVEHTDFIGLVRGRNESLPAPDAVSAFIIRMDTSGGLSIVERQADPIDPTTIKFGYESSP